MVVQVEAADVALRRSHPSGHRRLTGRADHQPLEELRDALGDDRVIEPHVCQRDERAVSAAGGDGLAVAGELGLVGEDQAVDEAVEDLLGTGHVDAVEMRLGFTPQRLQAAGDHLGTGVGKLAEDAAVGGGLDLGHPNADPALLRGTGDSSAIGGAVGVGEAADELLVVGVEVGVDHPRLHLGGELIERRDQVRRLGDTAPHVHPRCEPGPLGSAVLGQLVDDAASLGQLRHHLLAVLRQPVLASIPLRHVRLDHIEDGVGVGLLGADDAVAETQLVGQLRIGALQVFEERIPRRGLRVVGRQQLIEHTLDPVVIDLTVRTQRDVGDIFGDVGVQVAGRRLGDDPAGDLLGGDLRCRRVAHPVEQVVGLVALGRVGAELATLGDVVQLLELVVGVPHTHREVVGLELGGHRGVLSGHVLEDRGGELLCEQLRMLGHGGVGPGEELAAQASLVAEQHPLVVLALDLGGQLRGEARLDPVAHPIAVAADHVVRRLLPVVLGEHALQRPDVGDVVHALHDGPLGVGHGGEVEVRHEPLLTEGAGTELCDETGRADTGEGGEQLLTGRSEDEPDAQQDQRLPDLVDGEVDRIGLDGTVDVLEQDALVVELANLGQVGDRQVEGVLVRVDRT